VSHYFQKMRYWVLRFGITQKIGLSGREWTQSISDSTIETLAADESVVVLTETTSNVHHPTFINTIDTLITLYERRVWGFSSWNISHFWWDDCF
jgi:hypothetical protein